MRQTQRIRNGTICGLLVASSTALACCASVLGESDSLSTFLCTAYTDPAGSLQRIPQLEPSAERVDVQTVQHSLLGEQVQGSYRELELRSSQAVRLPPVLPEGGADGQHTIGADIEHSRWEPNEGPAAGPPVDDPVSETEDYMRGLDFGFWGWLSYLRTPQLDQSTFWAWETELDVTKSFSEHIAASADLEFVDTNRKADVSVEQLFVSIVLPNEQGTILTAGKFNAPFGVEPRDFWDRLTGSTSLIFRARPRDLTGVMFTHRLADTDIVIRPLVVNGFDDNLDVNESPSLALMAEYRPSDEFNVAVTNWLGPELPSNDADLLYFVDAQAVWFVVPEFSLSAEFLHGTTESPLDRLEWTGYLVLANYAFSERFRVYALWSWLDDADGFILGEADRRGEVSTGIGYYLHPNVELRLEYRHDYKTARSDLDHWDAHITFGY